MFAKYPGERELVPTWAREELMQSNLCNLDENPVFVLLGAIILGPKREYGKNSVHRVWDQWQGRKAALLMHRFLNRPLLTTVIQIFQKYKQTLNGILQFKFLNTTNVSNHEARWSRIP